MPVIEACPVLLDPVDTDFQPLPNQMLVAATDCTVYALDYKVPVHCLLTVKKMAAEDESEGFVLVCVRVVPVKR